ncbi:MAG TPA: DUF4881 domain-containing protein [Bryobacteraceae bacterium]|nr:DUF4881 domain-containing protein [Bryobacteraceae bacterium]
MPQVAGAGMAGIAATLCLVGCGPLGKVEQGRVIAYDRQTRQVTLIREAAVATRSSPGVLPPVTIDAPADPNEMGPAPVAGGRLLLDIKNRRIVVYDRATGTFRTIQYTPVAERYNVAKSPGPPVVDRTGKTITLYAAKDRAVITFAASDDLLAMPVSTWQAGDVVRYYYRDPGRALRLMNVTRTDLTKAVG